MSFLECKRQSSTASWSKRRLLPSTSSLAHVLNEARAVPWRVMTAGWPWAVVICGSTQPRPSAANLVSWSPRRNIDRAASDNLLRYTLGNRSLHRSYFGNFFKIAIAWSDKKILRSRPADLILSCSAGRVQTRFSRSISSHVANRSAWERQHVRMANSQARAEVESSCEISRNKRGISSIGQAAKWPDTGVFFFRGSAGNLGALIDKGKNQNFLVIHHCIHHQNAIWRFIDLCHISIGFWKRGKSS